MAATRSRPQSKKPPLTGTPCSPEDKLIVQKSTPLYGLWRSELSLADFKILDTYLSRINSHDPSRDTVLFEKGEIEKILGVTKINLPELKSRVKHLCTTVEVNDPTKKRAFRVVTLFDEAECEQDEDGLWRIRLTCSRSARKYFFNVEHLGYFRYKLRTITRLRSRYSYILFLYLEKNRHMHSSWVVDLDELKLLLKCDQEETYQEYKRFNAQILKRCHKELTENTECQFIYAPIKRGRTVKAIRFTLETLSPPELPDQLSMDDMITPPDDQIEFLRGACTPLSTTEPEFTRAEMEQLFTVLVTVPRDKLPRNVPVDSIEFRRYHYLAERYAAMNRLHEREPIQHRFSYLLKIVKKDAGTA